MKTIVVYQSGTGFTKKYAEWIAQELGCEAVTIKKALHDPESLRQYDHVVYGGWIMANMIRGLNKVIKLVPDKLTVFGVGGNEDNGFVIKQLVEANHTGDIPVYYFVGGMDYKKIGPFYKLILKTVKKEDYGNSFDHSDKNSIKQLVDLLRK